MVRHRRQKLVDQIAVRAVDFADVVAGIGGAACGIAERGEHGADVVAVHLDRHREATPCRQRARREAAPRRHAGPRVAFIERAPFLHCAMRAGVAAAMTELDRRHRAHLLDEVGDAAIRARLVIVPDAGAMIGLAPTRLDRGLLAEHDAGAAHRVAAEMHELPVGRAAIDRNVLTHRRHHDAIARGDATQRDRREQERPARHWCDLRICDNVRARSPIEPQCQ
jgi:hypothetical protein